MIVDKERRIGLDAIPNDLKSRMTDFQRGTLARLEGFGWSIRFVRRPLFQDQTIVLVDPAGKDHAILLEDGSLDRDLDLAVR
jgi:hypothetical protein